MPILYRIISILGLPKLSRDNYQDLLIILICSAILLILSYYIFQKTKAKSGLEETDEEEQYNLEITKTKLEIQQNLLKNISWELHDNIGQLLSTAHLEISMLADKENSRTRDSFYRISDLISGSLQEIRSISRNIKHETIGHFDLVESIKNDLSRIQKLNFLKTELILLGEPWTLNKNDTLFLFRIVQDFFDRSVHYSKAKKLTVILVFTPNELQITLRDDGEAYIPDEDESDSGLFILNNRAQFIGTQVKKGSVSTKGRKLKLTYPRHRNSL